MKKEKIWYNFLHTIQKKIFLYSCVFSSFQRPIKVPRNKIISNSVKKSRLPIYNYDYDKLVHDLNRRNSKLPKGWEFSIPDDDTVKLVFTPESSKYFLTCTLKRDTFLEVRTILQ